MTNKSPEVPAKLTNKISYTQLLTRSFLARSYLGTFLVGNGVNLETIYSNTSWMILVNLAFAGAAFFSARRTILYYKKTIERYNSLGGFNNKFYDWAKDFNMGCEGEGVQMAIKDIKEWEKLSSKINS